MNPIEQIFSKFKQHADLEYGERITITQHSFQTAWFAERDDADQAMIVAALLHDYGHYVHGLEEDIAEHGIDGCHEEAGAAALQQWFTPIITEPIRLHVPAKRYLCAIDADYFATLSAASVLSLQVQGGPYSSTECERFKQNPWHQRALQLRRYDEMGKEPNLKTHDYAYYRPLLAQFLQAA